MISPVFPIAGSQPAYKCLCSHLSFIQWRLKFFFQIQLSPNSSIPYFLLFPSLPHWVSSYLQVNLLPWWLFIHFGDPPNSIKIGCRRVGRECGGSSYLLACGSLTSVTPPLQICTVDCSLRRPHHMQTAASHSTLHCLPALTLLVPGVLKLVISVFGLRLSTWWLVSFSQNFDQMWVSRLSTTHCEEKPRGGRAKTAPSYGWKHPS